MKIGGKSYRTIWLETEDIEACKAVFIIDQTQLPHRFTTLRIADVRTMAHAIRDMQVRGAPLIGAAAAYGIALGTNENSSDYAVRQVASELISCRPTAVNLAWAVERMLRVLLALPEPERRAAAWREARIISDEDVKINKAIGRHGVALLKALTKDRDEPLNILTHCNAGWLATVDWGTALAPVYAAHDLGMKIHVWVDETRPRNQGASLTAWELAQHGVSHTVICDNVGGHLMQRGQVDCVIVGADRVTSKGAVCNKIGTYLKALAAFDNSIPFYAAVPTPTIDWSIRDGLSEIPIEERGADEISYVSGLDLMGNVSSVRIIPEGSPVSNPAFDVTPERLVTAIITEHGVFSPTELETLLKTSGLSR